MRSGFILLAFVAAASAGIAHQRAADQDLLKKQQDTIYLLEHITQGLPNQELYNLGYNYDIIAHQQNYEEPSIVLYYGGMVKAGHVQPQGTVYSNSVGELRKEVALLTRIFLGAKDYGTFLKTAAWARVWVNEGQFVKAYIAAILQREDTQGVIPPPLYEIFPHHYVDARVIQEAQYIKAKRGEGLGNTVVIPVNYTDYLPFGEHQLSYFTNDIGLNAWYAYISLAGYMIPEHHQQGLGGKYEGHHIGHGSYYYYLHQQLLAHYNLERLSNGLGPIKDIDFEHIQAPYKPHLRYTNGLEFPGRPDELYLTYTHHQRLIRNVYALEKRLLNAIDSGHVITPQQQFLSLYQQQGLNILGDLIEGTGRSVNPRYYGSLQAVARQLLGNTPDFVNIWSYTPSALELSETAVRDPAFFQLYKRVINLFHHYQQSLPAYQYNDLVLPGVKIEKVAFPDLVTYFDQYNINLENGIVQPEHVKEQEDVTIKAALHRLNHQQYDYQIHVQAEKPVTNAVVRVYLGPKFDYHGQPIDINHHRHYFVELDQFVHDIQEGQTVITRNSRQAPIHSGDYPSVHQIKVHVDSAVRSQNPFYITEPQQIFGFPARLSLPKGRRGGFPLQVLVVISSTEAQQVAYGPVVPPMYRTYQHHQFQVVDGEQYHQYVQQGHQQQQGVHHGGYKTVEVVPHFGEHGIFRNEINKHQAYYGHYLYMKHPTHFPMYYQHYYGHGHQFGGVHGHIQQHGVQGYPEYSHQYGGQQGVTGQQGLYTHQGQHVQGHHYQGVHGGQYQGVQGGQYQGVQGGQYQGVQGGQYQGVHGGQYHGVQGGQSQGVQGVQGVEGEQFQGVHGGQHYQGVHGGQHYQGVHGVHGQQYQQGNVETTVPIHTPIYQGQGIHGIHTGGVQGGVEGVLGGHGIHHQKGHYLTQYYKTKHISNIIGGAISLDNRPLGYPLERPLGPSAFYVPNMMVTDVIVYHTHNPGQTTH